MKSAIKIILALMIFNQVQAQAFNGHKEDINKILENTKIFSKYVMASDYEGIANSYTSEAKIFPNKMDILEGKDIKKYWTLPKGLCITYHKITQSEISIVNDTAYDYGYYEGKTKNAKGEEQAWRGKYVIVWKKIESDWKMYLDIWNSVQDITN